MKAPSYPRLWAVCAAAMLAGASVIAGPNNKGGPDGDKGGGNGGNPHTLCLNGQQAEGNASNAVCNDLPAVAGLKAAQVPGKLEVKLSWTFTAPAGVSVVSFELERDGVGLGNPGTAGYTDSTVEVGLHTYRVRARGQTSSAGISISHFGAAWASVPLTVKPPCSLPPKVSLRADPAFIKPQGGRHAAQVPVTLAIAISQEAACIITATTWSLTDEGGQNQSGTFIGTAGQYKAALVVSPNLGRRNDTDHDRDREYAISASATNQAGTGNSNPAKVVVMKIKKAPHAPQGPVAPTPP